jgi:hypothetical protein
MSITQSTVSRKRKRIVKHGEELLEEGKVTEVEIATLAEVQEPLKMYTFLPDNEPDSDEEEDRLEMEYALRKRRKFAEEDAMEKRYWR